MNFTTAIEQQKTEGKPRSPHWPIVRKLWLHGHPVCAACGSADRVEVHHKIPFHLRPELELEPENLISLCEGAHQCHLHFGHFFDWKRYNPDVERIAAAFHDGLLRAIDRIGQSKS